MRWIVRHAAWLIPRFRGSEVQYPFYRAMGGPYRGKLMEFGETVLAHLPEVGKGSGNPAPKLADRWKFGVWLGKSDLTDEHLVRTDDGVVYARSVRRLAENSWSEENLKAVVETPQKPRSMTTDDAADPRVVPEVHEQESLAQGRTSAQQEKLAPKLEPKLAKTKLRNALQPEQTLQRARSCKLTRWLSSRCVHALPARRCAVLLRNPPDKSPSGICPQVPGT